MSRLKAIARSLLFRVKPLAKLYTNAREKRTDFYAFQTRVHPETWARHDEVLRWADDCLARRAELENPENYLNSSDPLVRQGYQLKQKTEAEFRNKLADWRELRVLVYLPKPERSVGGYSLFRNMVMSLQFIGINARSIDWNEDLEDVLKEFAPSVLLTSDEDRDLAHIDWKAFDAYRAAHVCRFGLSASLEEYGNSPLAGRLEWARENHVDFYYSYFPQEYLTASSGYRPFYEDGYKVLSAEFGANILEYYPVPGIVRDIPYVFLGSRNRVKWDRYFTYFGRLCREYPGFIHGGGWLKLRDQSMNTRRDRFFYSRAQVCLNLHTSGEIRLGRECNERTYMLAACGAPMLIDNPALLPARFSCDSVFSASTPEEYFELFRYMRANPEEVQRRTLNAQQEAFQKHSSFIRMADFAAGLRERVQRPRA